MSILKRKLAAEPIQSGDINDVIGLFLNLHTQLTQQYGSMASSEVFAGTPSFTTDKFKSLTGNAKGLIYALGDKYKPCQLLVELSPPLAENVTNDKLGIKPNKDNKLTLFDLILMQPIVETALHELLNLGIAIDGDKICARCTSPKDITHMGIELDTRQKWLCVHFPLTTEGNTPDNGHTIKIYFDEVTTRALSAMVQSKQKNIVVDPTDPWTSHMRNMIMDSTQMLEVVIEDITMSIAECTRLELGQIITLPGASHTRLNVNARSPQGVQVLATSTLGVYKANKAVKFLDDINPVFLAGIADVEPRKSHV